ncbi:MAG: hypothetical protein MUD01_17525, partial [Chloroflexaceae bacterium]|nr:hypothetical protein [Chloroflexaceae bacterium]
AKCNNEIKNDRLDLYDYHYELISLPLDENDRGFENELVSHHKVAVYAKSNYSCVACGQPAHRIGKLNVGRKDSTDSWHFLNMVAYCDNCKIEG